MGDANVLRGIQVIVNKNNAKPNINHDEIVNLLVKGGQMDGSNSDPAEQAKKEISEFAKQFGIDLKPEETKQPSGQEMPEDFNILEDPMEAAPESFQAMQPARNFEGVNLRGQPDQQGYSGQEYEDTNTDNYQEEEQVNINPGGPATSPWLPQNMSSTLEDKTQEELRQDQIKKVMNEMGDQSKPFNIEQEKIEDSKTNMLEEIDFLTGVLEDAGVKGLDRIPKRTISNSYKEIEDVLKSLRLKHDKTRYSSLANELIMLGVLQMEDIFDGKRVWFNRWQPDLTDWHKNVQIKLQKMRHDTSTIVSNIIREYNIGPAFRVILELIPNMFMYSRNRKSQRSQRTLGEDKTISDAIGKIRQATE